MMQPQHEAERERSDDAEQQRHKLAAGAVQQRDRDEIGRATEEHRGAERYQPRIAHEQVHARAVERVDRDLRHLARLQPEQRGAKTEPDQHDRDDEHGMREAPHINGHAS